MWKQPRPTLPSHLYKDVFNIRESKQHSTIVKSNQLQEENPSTRIRNENQVLGRLGNNFFSSQRTGIDPKRVPTYSPGPIYEPAYRTVTASRTYDFGKSVDRNGTSARSRRTKKSPLKQFPSSRCRRLSMGIPPPRQTPKTRPKSSLKRLESIVNGHSSSIRADSRRTLYSIPIQNVETLFKLLDKDRDGVLSLPEFQLGMKRLGVAFGKDSIELFDLMDVNGDNVVDKIEFRNAIDSVSRRVRRGDAGYQIISKPSRLPKETRERIPRFVSRDTATRVLRPDTRFSRVIAEDVLDEELSSSTSSFFTSSKRSVPMDWQSKSFLVKGGTRPSRHELVLESRSSSSGGGHYDVVPPPQKQSMMMMNTSGVGPFGKSNRFDEFDEYSYHYDSRKSPGPVYSSYTSLNSTFNNNKNGTNKRRRQQQQKQSMIRHRDTSMVSEDRIQELRRELSDRGILISLESKRMVASRDRYAVATLPSFRSVIIMSNIDVSPAEIDALYESFPLGSTWYDIISTLRLESKRDRPKTSCSSASRCVSRRGNNLRPKVPFLIRSKEGARTKIHSLLKFSSRG